MFRVHKFKCVTFLDFNCNLNVFSAFFILNLYNQEWHIEIYFFQPFANNKIIF
ncbi:MAG: hypothetical protein H6Q20_1215 [Bacteroidetes bacterium]|nr:hypothetical protein [Bacteroidota bacterium]